MSDQLIGALLLAHSNVVHYQRFRSIRSVQAVRATKQQKGYSERRADGRVAEVMEERGARCQ